MVLPNGWKARVYQIPFFQAMGRGIKRACLIWHRRAGKDATTLNWIWLEAYRKVGTYYYFFPTYGQGKKILWDGIDAKGKRFLSYIPHFDKCKLNETEMQIKLPNGSIIQIVGTDRMDYIVGTNPIGCVFSEYAIQNPKAWSYVRPILAENGGWAVFVYTPRGQNHGSELYNKVKDNPKWFCSLLTVNDTVREDGSPVISMDEIEEARAEGEDEDIIQQEFFCSFHGGMQGSYYSRLVERARGDGRIGIFGHIPGRPVHTYWDIGHSDYTVIGLAQHIHGKVIWIDCIYASGEGLPYFASALLDAKKEHGYQYGTHNFPHDMAVTDFGSGEQRIVAARNLGIRPARIVPKMDLLQGIDAVRRSFPTYCFDENRCKPLIQALTNYRKKVDEKTGYFSKKPHHDANSDFADMVRMQATAMKPQENIHVNWTTAETDGAPLFG